jgi:membrane-associated phospholipid phosphatase
MRQFLPGALFQRSETFDGRGQTRFLPGAIVCYLLLIVFYAVLVGTDWGHEFDDDAYFGRGAVSRPMVTLDAALLMRISDAKIMAAAGFLFLFSLVRGRVLVGVVAVAGFFFAVIGAETLKDLVFHWRALVPNDARLGKELQVNSYPSGHATIATAFLLGLLLVSPTRWLTWLAPVAGALTSIFAGGVLFAGWHRGSDALGALAWSGFCMNLAAAAAVRIRGRPAIGKPRRALLGSIILGVLILLVFYLITAMAAPRYPHHDLPFLVVAGFIIAGSLALPAWYGIQMRLVDFSKPKESKISK